MPDIEKILKELQQGDKKTLARCITMVENELEGYDALLQALPLSDEVPVIGITGPPGAGKSTLINSLLKELTAAGKKVGVIAIDPTSPFNFGSLLGDRLRMSEHFNSEQVFIRSLATRGSLGGLSAKTIEVVDVMRAFGFDYILVETVGVGQSEIEIIGLADTTILVLVPEAGDEVQAFKSGIMEIADIFVVNKADRDGADLFIRNLHQLLHMKKAGAWIPPVIKAVATKDEGSDKILEAVMQHRQEGVNEKKPYLYAEKAYRLIQNQRMKGIDKKALKQAIEKEMQQPAFNLYAFVRAFIKQNLLQ